ncbi:MAG: imidazole glycerol phosphate synthase subunit HisH [Acidobacteriota bacterium]
MIALIDYGAGNLTSVRKALGALDATWMTPSAPADLAEAAGIIVPGVGHFASTRALDEAWRQGMQRAVERGTAILGICLGMQWLFEGSAEAPELQGFGAFRGVCGHLTEINGQNLQSSPTPLRKSWKMPHVGWNSLALTRDSRLMAQVPDGAQVYFTHSFAAPRGPDTVAITTYGATFAAAVERGRLAGVQFHPEKSGDIGLRILRNWLTLCEGATPLEVSRAV